MLNSEFTVIVENKIPGILEMFFYFVSYLTLTALSLIMADEKKISNWHSMGNATTPETIG